MERSDITQELRTERIGNPERTADTRVIGRPVSPRGGGRAEELVLGRYRLDRRLGAGGFGVVWAAVDERLEREVAVKVIPHGDDSRGPEREARAVARLNHPGIVALYELGSDEDAVYLVSELVRGSTLGELMRAGAVSDRDVARIGLALCDALAHAHEKGVIHRDVKPQNVLVAAEPAAGAGFAKLADFGVAHMGGGDPLTRTGDVVGTLAYMAPEQAEGQRVTPAADIYSLALTLFEGWTGENPVRAASPAATARRLGGPLPALGRLRRDLPAGLCAAVDAALEPHPGRRPPLGELRTALAAAADSLSDQGGLVEPANLERFGLATGRGTRVRPRAPLPARLLAALAAGGVAALALSQLPPAPVPFSPVAAAGATALLVALLPRLGWLAAAGAFVLWLATEGEAPGLALVVAAGLAAVPLLAPRAGTAWSLPGAAPLLGAIGLAPGFVALAGLGRTAWRRAGLGAAGFVWLALVEVGSGESLLFGAPGDSLPHASWEGSASAAARDALWPLLSTPALAPALVWGAFAAALPLALRGRSLGLDVVRGAIWAAALVAAHSALAELLAGQVALADARGAVAGAVLGVAGAVAYLSVRPQEGELPL